MRLRPRDEAGDVIFPDEKPTVRVARPVELAPPCPKLRRYREPGGWSIDSGGERVWDPASGGHERMVSEYRAKP